MKPGYQGRRVELDGLLDGVKHTILAALGYSLRNEKATKVKEVKQSMRSPQRRKEISSSLMKLV